MESNSLARLKEKLVNVKVVQMDVHLQYLVILADVHPVTQEAQNVRKKNPK